MQASVRVFQPKQSLLIICLMAILVGIGGKSWGQTLIAGWDFTTTTNGGTAAVAAPSTPTTFLANFPSSTSGTLYLNGTNGSSSWSQSTELSAFGGTAVNAATGFSTTTSGASSLALLGGTSNSANSKSVVIKFSMSGYTNLVVSYATQKSGSTAFSTQKWDYSIDGTNWTTITTITSVPAAYATQTLSTVTGLDNATNAYLRLTVTGSTAAAANNRLDNIQLNATSATAVVLTPSSTSISGLNYAYGAGPSSSGSFTISGSNLSANGSITATAPTNFEVSSDNSTWGSTASLPYTGTGIFASNTFYVRLAAGLAVTTYSGSIGLTGGGAIAAVTVSGAVTNATPPTLIPATGVTVDASFDVTFTDNALWRTNISSITVGGVTLTAGYTVSAGKITFTPSASVPATALQTAGSKSIIVNATNYTATTTISQTISAGVATKLGITKQPAMTGANGSALSTQPIVAVQDQYVNTTTSTASITATATQATWTLGGTTTLGATAGVTTFSNLTATSAAAVIGATITFSATGFTSIQSNTFDIPAPVPAIALSSPSQTASGNILKGSSDNVIYNFQLAVTNAGTTLSSVAFTTTGSALTADVSNFKLFYNTLPSSSGASQIGTSITTTTGAGAHTFSSLSQTLAVGTTGYYFIKASISSTATTSRTIVVTPITTSNITVTSGTTKSGTTTTGGTQTISALTPPSLTATTPTTSVDNNFTVTYGTDAAFTSAITSVTISNGTATTLTSGVDYTLSGNNTITFTPSVSGNTLLHAPGAYTISVNATNYNPTSVTQTLTVGAASKLGITTQPAAPNLNGYALATQPVIAVQDQYGNATTSNASITATVGAGAWTLGGTVTVVCTSGTATYTNLTATSTVSVTGATITFSATGLTPITSGTFNIPTPVVDYITLTAAGTTVTENFDGMSTSSTATIPTGFKANIRTGSPATPSWGDATTYNKTNTTQAAGTSGTGILIVGSAGGLYNFANGVTATATDRGLGYITSSNYPVSGGSTSNTGVSILSKIKNSTGSTVQQVTVAFDYEKYLGGSSPSTWTFYYSLDGSTWISLPNGTQAYPADASTTPYNPPTTVTKSVAIPNINLADGAYLYLRWSDASGGTSGQAIGIDNFSIVAQTLPVITTQPTNAPASCQGSAITQTFSVAANGSPTSTYQWQYSSDKVTFTNVNDNTPTGFTYTNSTSSSLNVQIATSALAGVYYYRAVVSNTVGSTASDTVTVTINALPTASVTATSSTLCVGENTTLNFTGPINGTLYYTINGSTTQIQVLLDNQGKATGSTNNLNVGTNTFTIVSVTNGTCTNNSPGSSASVTVNALPAILQIGGPDYIPVGSTGSYSNATVGGGVWSIDNTANAALSDIALNSVTVNGLQVSSPTLTYTVTDAGTGCTNSTSLPINIYDPAIARYRTATNIATTLFTTHTDWEKLVGNGWIVSPEVPGDAANIEVRNQLIVDQTYNGSDNASFKITETGSISGSMIINPDILFQSQGGVNFNGRSVTVRSTTLGTGSIGQMKNPVSGATNVTVERYIPGRRAWRFLSIPTISSTQTINQAWMEGAAPNPNTTTQNNPLSNYGTEITYTGPANGFDAGLYNNSSLKVYSTGGSLWVPVSSTSNLINDYGVTATSYPAYCIFIRGDRSVNISQGANAPATPTTLRTTGSINFGSFTHNYTTIAGGKVLISNPFASAISITQVLANNATKFNQNTFWVWDPVASGEHNVGGYVTISPVSGILVPMGSNYQGGTNAQSGQAFMLEATGGATTTISFSEADKVNSQANVFGREARQPASTIPAIFTNLLAKNDDSSLFIADGVGAGFGKQYSEKVTSEDSKKMWNFDENLSLYRDTNNLAIEFRPVPKKTDTLFFKLYLKQQPYTLQVFSQNLPGNLPARGWLVDKYLNTQTEVNLYDTTLYSFTPNSDTNSYRNRFMLVFNRVPKDSILASASQLTMQPANGIKTSNSSIRVYPNPVSGGKVNLYLTNLKGGTYNVSVYSNGGEPVYQKKIVVGQDGAAQNEQLLLGKGLSQGSYQIKVSDYKGSIVLSDQLIIVK